MEGKTNVVFYFYVLEKHYANCKRTSSTRKITDEFRRTSEEKEGERSVENEKETEKVVTSDNSNIVVEEEEQ